MRRTMIIGALLAGGLALAGCTPTTEAPSPNPPAPGTPPPVEPAAQGEGHGAGDAHSSTDQEFAQQMLTHHEQALELVGLAEATSQNPQVRALATRIAQTQGPEIVQLKSWLAAKSGHESGSAPEDVPHHGGMTGMVKPQEMEALRLASGPEFDRQWVQAMIQHHEGAVEMAQAQLSEGSDPELQGFAEKVVATQQAEIQELKSIQVA